MLRKEIDLDWIRKYPGDLKNAKKQTYGMCIEAVRRNGLYFMDIRWGEVNLSYEEINNICVEAVKENCLMLRVIDKVVKFYRCPKNTFEICIEVIKEAPEIFKEMPFDEINLTQKEIKAIYLEYLKKTECDLSIVEDQAIMYLEIVKLNGRFLKYIKNQTEGICLEAVKNYGPALKYVRWNKLSNNRNEKLYECSSNRVKYFHAKLNKIKNKFSSKENERICLEAVRQNALALKYVNKQTEPICMEALKQNKHAIMFIKDKNKCLKEFNIRYLEKQGDTREVIAIKENNKWLFTIACQRDITKEEFVDRIYNTNGGFDLKLRINVHRQRYLNFLKDFY
ncbi:MULTISPECIES: DUF4116 domain-containing protein [unclassified Clostridioides]|uniref:DUF4116 domain-containing protein n=2 Tax=Clostridioides TaxID=1870884 RepID=UPI001D11EE39|nr:DUF4116 domain-containing protein [Clostridioides sp. ES-S-0005-03]MCC0709254.1 DUF4116 domain-containing protein [Clostridioides sp. ES-S-0190-01]UDN64045.1 DUF4116 domain-containing protein [Clostridioides sp. ES-W-0016-02]